MATLWIRFGDSSMQNRVHIGDYQEHVIAVKNS